MKLFNCFLFISSIVFSQIPTNGQSHAYDFDSSTTNLFDDNAGSPPRNFSANGNTFVRINNRFGNANSAITLNQTYLTRTDVLYPQSKGTISFWIKTTQNDNNERIIYSDSDKPTVFANSNWAGHNIYIRSGRIGYEVQQVFNASNIGRIFTTEDSNKDISDGNWHHIALVIDQEITLTGQSVGNQPVRNYKTTVELYIDDDVFETSSINVNTHLGIQTNKNWHTTNFNTGGAAIGNLRSLGTTNNQRYEGGFDGLLIYSRALNGAEVDRIANDNFCFSPSNPVSVNSVTSNSANVRISQTSSKVFDVAYHKITEPFSNATIISNLTDPFVINASLTNLDAFNSYRVYIREQCNVTSPWSNFTTFMTQRPADPVYVNKTATGANNGSSWADAYTDLQDALTNIQADQVIWVAAGTYYPHASSRNTYFQLDKDNLKIYGGFDGTETQLSDRVFGSNETILSGDLNNNDINVSGFANNYANTSRNGDNSYHIVNITANNILLDRLTISDAHNNLNALEPGGAIVKEKTVAYLTIKNCKIKDNVSRNDNAGLMAEFELTNATGFNGALIIENCEFTNNMSRWASGVYSFVRPFNNITITIANTLFDSNIADDLSSTVKGLSGSASWLRAVDNDSNVTLNLTNNTYVNNIDLGTMGTLNNFTRATVGISKQSGISSAVFNATVSNCIFWNNTTSGGTTTRSITDLILSPINNLTVLNSIDEANFNDNSISSKTNTISSNPLFTDLANGDYTLSALSPAIDTGNNSNVFGSLDLLGNQRILNTTIDMGAYEFSSVALGLNDFQNNKNNISLYPNPTTAVLNIKMDKILKQAIIYSVLGQEVLKTQQKTIRTDNLKSGIYLIKIEDESGLVSTKRFVKQ